MHSARLALPVLVAVGLFVSRDARAECTTDIECKGDRICVDGACVDPAPAVASPAPPSEATLSAAAPATAVREAPPRTERRSQALFVSGIVSLALVPVALGVSSLGWFQKESCKMDASYEADVAAMQQRPAPPAPDCGRYDGTMYGGAVASVVLLGGGLAMLLVGVQKVPVERPSSAIKVRPWFSPTTAGVGLHTTF